MRPPYRKAPEAPVTMREHFDQTHHTVIEILGTPWYCQDCPVRSPLYGLPADNAGSPNPPEKVT